jgi:DNA-binding response OmpR family regulator
MNTSVIENEAPALKTSEVLTEIPQQKKRILIVESDTQGARKLALQVGSAAYDVITHDAANAVAAAKKLPPDLVIVDLSMLGEAGFGLAARIQQTVLWCVPTMFVAATTEPDLRKKAELFEAVGFFEGAYDAKELVSAIALALREEDSEETAESLDVPQPMEQ